jgi:hypothetical protein
MCQWRVPYIMQTKLLTLKNGTNIPVPRKAYPWLMEWTWEYSTELHQVVRIEHGRTIFLLHELIKHGAARNPLLSLDEAAIDFEFSEYPSYARLIDDYHNKLSMPHMSNTVIVLPNPYELIGLSLTSVLELYFSWLRSGKCYMLDLNKELPAFVCEPREDPSPYYMSEEYPTLGDWMHQEWSGVLSDDTPPSPTTFIDQTNKIVMESLQILVGKSNPGFSTDTIFEHFDEHGDPLESFAEHVHGLLESYKTPAR